MTFLILFIIAVLLYFSFAVYRKIYSVVLSIIFIFIPPLLLFYLGAEHYGSNEYLTFVSERIPPREFYHLIGVWCLINLVCSALIIKNYIAYLRVNKKRFPG